VKNTWQTFLNFLRNALTNAITYIQRAFTNINWGQVGRNILLGIANGMLLGLPSLLTVVANIAKQLLAQIKKSLGIASDSKEGIKLGFFTGHGFTKGLQMGANPEEMARSLVRPITNSSTSTQQTIIQNFASGLTVSQARRMIAENNEQLVNTMVSALSG